MAVDDREPLVEDDSAPLLRTEHLSRRLSDGTLLVDDVSIELRRGEMLALVGPSGAGKSSFLRLLNRLDEPTGGTVYLRGRDYRDIPPHLLRRQLGLVMQTPHLFPGTVADNVRFGPRQLGKRMTAAAVAGLLERVGLGGYGDREVSRLSGGEAQRVSLARVLANDPSVLLLDEPTSALDDASKREIEALICRIQRRQDLACLIVTHDLAQARRLAKQAMVLERGALRRLGPVTEVLGA